MKIKNKRASYLLFFLIINPFISITFVLTGERETDIGIKTLSDLNNAACQQWNSSYLIDNFTINLDNVNRTYCNFKGKTISIRYRPIEESATDPIGTMKIADDNWEDGNGGDNTFYTEQDFGAYPLGMNTDLEYLSYIIFEKQNWPSENVSLHFEYKGAYPFIIEVYNITSKYHIPKDEYNPIECLRSLKIDLFKVNLCTNVNKTYSNLEPNSDYLITLISNETLSDTSGQLIVADHDIDNISDNFFWGKVEFSSWMLNLKYVLFAYSNWVNNTLKLRIENTAAYDFWILIEKVIPCCFEQKGDFLIDEFKVDFGGVYRRYCEMEGKGVSIVFLPNNTEGSGVGSDISGTMYLANEDYSNVSANTFYLEEDFASYPTEININNSYYVIFAKDVWQTDTLDLYIKQTGPYEFIVQIYVVNNAIELPIIVGENNLNGTIISRFKVEAGKNETKSLSINMNKHVAVILFANETGGLNLTKGILKIGDLSVTNTCINNFYGEVGFFTLHEEFIIFGKNNWPNNTIELFVENTGDYDFWIGVIEITFSTTIITPLDQIPGYFIEFLLLTTILSFAIIYLYLKKHGKIKF